MKKKVVLWAAVGLCLMTSCLSVSLNSGTNETQHRQLKGFERIELLGAIDVKYQQADSFSVMVRAPKELLDKVETDVNGKTLVVKMKGDGNVINIHQYGDDDDVTVYVTSPDFLGITLKGSGDFEALHQVDTDVLDIRLKGSGDMEFHDVICDQLHLSVVGSGDVGMKKVEARNSQVEIVGSGDVSIRQSRVDKTDMQVKGSGDLVMFFDRCGIVNARLVGSGDMVLSGDVQQLKRYVRGSGDIVTAKLTVGSK